MEDQVKKELLKQMELLQQKSQDPGLNADSLAKLTDAMVSVSMVLLGGSQSFYGAGTHHPYVVQLPAEDLVELYVARAQRARRTGESHRT